MESRKNMPGSVTQGKEGLRRGGASAPLHSQALFFFKEEGWKVKRVCAYACVHTSGRDRLRGSFNSGQQPLKVRKCQSGFRGNMHIHYISHTGCHSLKDLSARTRIAGALHQAPRPPPNQESMFIFPLSSWHDVEGCGSQTCPPV